MARNPQQIDRATEFWDRHTRGSYLVDEKSLAALESAIEAIEGKPTFSLDHMNAFILAISVCEAQIRDCIRLAFDTPGMPIEADNALFKDLRPDYMLLNSIRERRVSLGEFFAHNISISTIERFFSGAEFGLPYADLAADYTIWEIAKAQAPQVAFSDLKASLAFAFERRNRFVHEFSEMIASEIGKPHENERQTVSLRNVLLLLRFVQYQKTSHYSRAYSELHPVRGEVGKQLNLLSAKIQSEFDGIEALLRIRKSRPDLHLPEAVEVRRAVAAFRNAHNEYLTRLSQFYRAVHGPGTIVGDFVYAAYLENLQQFEKHVDWALYQTRFIHDPSSQKI
ncbi:hypothetical protein [Bradyrhizobium sp.]|jgi:hypothetical protein|uniref:hypothetical protein n=1 Tax=Bradyrhizobium sp. TaxID=376 RepID=UPI003C63AEBC